MLCMNSSGLGSSMASQWSEFLTFHPAWWWCNHRMGCWWNWCWLQPAAFHPRSPLVRESHKRVCAQTEKNNVTVQRNFPFRFCGKALKIKYSTHLSYSHNETTQLPSVSRRVFYWEWADNEIKKLHFAFALIKKEGLSFPLQDTRDQNNKAANRKTCLGGFQDAGRFPRSHQAFRIYIN